MLLTEKGDKNEKDHIVDFSHIVLAPSVYNLLILFSQDTSNEVLY